MLHRDIMEYNKNEQKRKLVYESCYNNLLENTIKRIRITLTPGEIRLSKDLKDVEGINDVDIQLTDDPATVIINFKMNQFHNIPSQFLVKVPRYYPHSSPIVTCLQDEFKNSHYISSSSVVCHQDLQHNWSAIDTIQTVISILKVIRNYNHIESNNNEYLHSTNSTWSIDNKSVDISNNSTKFLDKLSIQNL